ncbi:hypothetical protein O6H91_21G049100 [Diphasiastrum complanatum]|uniref:Uncharacterized protein n=2 Tax=Diphasiastrum complanatum TaxID=34168 RepID=A0ACC2AKB8_DIPCM|nr:hypothetical protein O6H91_21G049100 [Diphasiastrum complanatum]
MDALQGKISKWKFVLLLVMVSAESGTGQLSVDYYKASCPNLETIVQQTMVQKFNATPVVAGGMLRLVFHDCMVLGCDASVLISSTQNNTAEKDADDNLSLPGDAFDGVMRAKAAVEAQCPGVVSCADLLVIAARDLLAMVGGPSWEVAKGRLDGKISMASAVPGNLPSATDDLDKLTALFASKGLNQSEMVALSGAHSVGFAHCNQFMRRVYNFNATYKIDPTINPLYAAQLRESCPQVNLDPTVVVFLDDTTPRIFDNVYYQNAQKGLALLSSDQVLFTDERTRPIVNSFAADNSTFLNSFVSAMQKLTSVGVKTRGSADGEIRQNCGAVNT